MHAIYCSKTLLKALEDTEQSSAVGSAVVLKNFIRMRGSELFHAVPELVRESLTVSETRFVVFVRHLVAKMLMFEWFFRRLLAIVQILVLKRAF